MAALTVHVGGDSNLSEDWQGVPDPTLTPPNSPPPSGQQGVSTKLALTSCIRTRGT